MTVRRKGLTIVTLILPVILMAGCCRMPESVKPIVDDVFKKAALTEPLPPTAFTSDGCSLWFDGDWVECCVLHDLAYWRGGTSGERQKADRVLKQCVAERSNTATAAIMYAGVRAGGVWWLPTCFRWGYGWDYPQTGPPGTGSPASDEKRSSAVPSSAEYPLTQASVKGRPHRPCRTVVDRQAQGTVGFPEAVQFAGSPAQRFLPGGWLEAANALAEEGGGDSPKRGEKVQGRQAFEAQPTPAVGMAFIPYSFIVAHAPQQFPAGTLFHPGMGYSR